MAKSKAKAKASKQTGGKKNVLAVGLAVVFLAGCVFCGAGIGLRDKTNGKWYSTSSWYHNWGKGEKPGQTGTPASSAVISEGESNGIALLCDQIPVEDYADYGITRQSDNLSYYSLSVEYEPENTTFQETDITASFKNSNSTWAKGKNVNNYVSLNHEDGAKTATLYILKGFEEQIVVTARSQRVPELYATATVDFICDSVYFTLISNKADDIDNEYQIERVNWSGGTVLPNSENCIELQFTLHGFANYMQSKGYTNTKSDTYSYFMSYSEDIIGGNFVTPRQIILGLIGSESYSDDPQGTWNYACKFLLNGRKPESLTGSAFVECHMFLHSKYSREYDDGSGFIAEIGVFETDSFDLEVYDWSGFEVKATNITIKPSDIVGW